MRTLAARVDRSFTICQLLPSRRDLFIRLALEECDYIFRDLFQPVEADVQIGSAQPQHYCGHCGKGQEGNP